MSNLYLRNNIIAFLVHFLIVAVSFIPTWFVYPGSSYNTIFDSWLFITITRFAFLFIYVACGFFLLKPVTKLSFLSVISVAIVLIISFIYSILSLENVIVGLDIYSTNPISMLLIRSDFGVFSVILVPILLLTPSLFMWLGMMLRKLIRG